EEHQRIAEQAEVNWRPHGELADDPRALTSKLYGLIEFGDLFTSRQLVTLTTLSDLVNEVCSIIKSDARKAGLPDDDRSLIDKGNGATAYSQAVSTYLGMGVSRLSDIANSLCMWENTKTQVRHLFTRQ